jgi:hypothetical protein
MKLNTKSDNPNYTAKVISLPAPRKHANADKLQVVTIDGNNVITGLDAKEGMLYIYFPLESALNAEYLSYTNSYSSPELNRDKAVKGFFGSQGRVKAVKLRSQPSEGYIVPVKSVIEWLDPKGITATEADFEPNTIFDSIDDLLICEKYVNKEALRKLANAEKSLKNRQGKAKRTSKMIEGQFRLHVDTKQLKREIGAINPDDMVSITYKLHGSSGICSKLLVKRKLKWFEKIAAKLGVNINESVYDYVWSSRRVIKSAEYMEDDAKDVKHYYDTDIWNITAERLKPFITEGITLYYEIVGQTPTGGWIQGEYDYGTKPNELDIYVYRITSTNVAGQVIEFTRPQVERYCARFGLKTPKCYFYGRAKDIYPDISTQEHWHQNLLERLKKDYNEKNCYMCANKVPEEGVVVVVEKDYFDAFKLKSFAFLERETKEIDKGNVDIETAQSEVPATE